MINKKIFYILPIIILFITFVPNISVKAASEISYNETTKTLTVTKSGEIKNDDVKDYADKAEHIVVGTEVTSLGYRAFYNFEIVKDITFQKGSKLTSLGKDAIAYNYELETINIPDGLKSIDEGAFYYCHKLKAIDLPEGLNSIGVSAFLGCYALESITFPSTIDTLPVQVCSACTGLKRVTFAGKITSIGIHSFYGCESLESIILPEGLTEIPETMFQSCYNLHSITIPEGVKKIGDRAFSNISTLGDKESILVLPDSLLSIGSSVFFWSELDAVYIPGNVNYIAEDAFNGIDENTTIYYEEGSYVEDFLKRKGIKNIKTYYNLTDYKYEWAPDYSACKASAVAKLDRSRVYEENGVITSEVIKEPTTESKGLTRYTAEFENIFFKTQILDVETDKLPSPTPEPADKDVEETDIEEVEKSIIDKKDDKDLKGSCFHIIQPKAVKTTSKSIRLTWKKVKGAKTFVVFGSKCGKKNKYEKLGTTTKNSFNVKKIKNKKLKKGTYYKFIIVAVGDKDKVISTSTVIHAATAGGKVGNVKSLVLKPKKIKLTLKVNKSFRFKVNKKLPAKKKVKNHTGKAGIRYESDNSKVAVVNKNGKIKGLSKGKCNIYIYAQNGVCKKIKVTVK